jgi:polyisoprenoid-binding protein YceI
VFTDAERAALELTAQGTRIADAAGGVTDEAWANAAKHCDDDQLAALVSHPLMTFRSTGIRATGDGEYALDGELTLNGVTRPVTLDVEFYGVGSAPWDDHPPVSNRRSGRVEPAIVPDHCRVLLGLLGNGEVSWSPRVLASHCW